MRRAILFLVCACCCGCGLFSTQPLLPKQATTELSPNHPDEWTRTVASADIIYFPVETIVASGDDSVTKLVQALRDSGTPFAIGWQGVEPDIGDAASASEARWTYAGQLRDRCRTVMRDTIDTRQLFLGLPRGIRTKLQDGSPLSGDERKALARGYRAPTGGLEDFAEQLAAVRGLQERDIENLYRAHVVAGQFAAEKIVGFMREHAGEKLLILARRRELTGDCGLPAFVAQKITVRQVTLDRGRARSPQPRLVSARFVRRSLRL